MDAAVEQNINEECIAFAKRFALNKPQSERRAAGKAHAHTCFVTSSCSSLGNVTNASNFVPTRKGMAV